MNEPALTPSRWFDVWVWMVMAMSGFIYVLIALMAETMPPDHPQANSIETFLWLMTAQWLLYLSVVIPIVRNRRMSLFTFWSAIVFAFLVRAILLPSDLILENDIYRYLWDGKVSAHGINPYLYPPSSVSLEHLRGETWPFINYPDIRTIYPPILQAVFWLAYWIYPESVTGMKLILLGFDAVTIVLLVSFLSRTQRQVEASLLYAWSPLVIREVANAGHADAVAGVFIVGLLWAMSANQKKWSAFILAMLIATKLYAVLFVPIGMKKWGGRWALLVIGWIVLFYLPFVSAGITIFEGTRIFSQEWRFNAGLFAGIELLWSWLSPGISADRAARYTCGMMVLLVAVVVWWKAIQSDSTERLASHFLVLTGALLMFSPVINPWYLIWIVPLLVFCPNAAWLYWSGSVQWSYAYYLQREMPMWCVPGQWLPIIVLFYLQMIWKRRKRAFNDSSGSFNTPIVKTELLS